MPHKITVAYFHYFVISIFIKYFLSSYLLEYKLDSGCCIIPFWPVLWVTFSSMKIHFLNSVWQIARFTRHDATLYRSKSPSDACSNLESTTNVTQHRALINRGSLLPAMWRRTTTRTREPDNIAGFYFTFIVPAGARGRAGGAPLSWRAVQFATDGELDGVDLL